ncbi:hypothetical protein QFZ30_002059 [Arthrobacter pascens]|nr:hypothetical protein [Arthrobacter pascens]
MACLFHGYSKMRRPSQPPRINSCRSLTTSHMLPSCQRCAAADFTKSASLFVSVGLHPKLTSGSEARRGQNEVRFFVSLVGLGRLSDRNAETEVSKCCSAPVAQAAGRRIPVAAGIGLSWERRDAEQFQTGQGPPRAGAGESRRRHGDLGRECPRRLPWHTIGCGALRLGSQACHCGPGSAWPRAATRLVARLEQMAAAAGARRVILQTGGNQPEAEALYPKIA